MAVNISHIGMPGRHSGCKRRPSNFSRISFSTVLQVSHRSLGEEVRRLRAVLFINSADKTKLSCSTPSDSAPQFLKKITSLFISAWSKSGLQSLVLGHCIFVTCFRGTVPFGELLDFAFWSKGNFYKLYIYKNLQFTLNDLNLQGKLKKV